MSGGIKLRKPKLEITKLRASSTGLEQLVRKVNELVEQVDALTQLLFIGSCERCSTPLFQGNTHVRHGMRVMCRSCDRAACAEADRKARERLLRGKPKTTADTEPTQND